MIQPETIAHAINSLMIDRAGPRTRGYVLAKRTSLPPLSPFAISLNFAHHTVYFVSRKVDFGIARLFLNDAPTRRIRLSGPDGCRNNRLTSPTFRFGPIGGSADREPRVSSDFVGADCSPFFSPVIVGTGPICGTSAFPKLLRRVWIFIEMITSSSNFDRWRCYLVCPLAIKH